MIDALEGTKLNKTTNEEWMVMEWKTIRKIQVYLSDEVKYILGNQGGFMEEIMEESRRVVYGKVTYKSVGTEASTI